MSAVPTRHPCRPRRTPPWAGWTLLVVLGAVTLTGQKPDPPAPPKSLAQFQARVDLVTLDVSVIDRDRRPVRGLTAADFTVLEDGQPQPIQTFSAIDLPDVEAATASWVRDVPADVHRNDDLADRRIVAIVIDDALPMNTLAADPAIVHVKRVASEVINQLGPRDLAAVVFPLSKDRGQDFTTDRDRLLKAIDRWQPGFADLPGETRGLVAMRQQFLYRSLMSTIRMLTQYLSDLPNRRKALVLVSEGIPLDLEVLNPADLSPGGVPTGVLQIIMDELRETFAAAQRANVSIYPIDPAGLRTAMRTITVDFLRGLASNTGGYPVVDTNDTASGVRQIMLENSSYYLVGYATTNPRMAGRYRKIAVKVDRPGVTVRARTGYFEPEKPNPAKTPAKPPDPTWKALAALVPTGDVAMQATAAVFAVPGRRENAVAIVTALRQPMPVGQERVIENVDLLLQAYDPGGSRRGGERHKVRLVLRPNEYQPDINYELISRVDLRPGRYQVRMAATSSMQGRSGSVYLDVDVPDYSKLALSMSGVLMNVAPGVTTAPKDKLAGVVPIVPTTERAFAPSDRVVAFVRVYQGGKQPPAPAVVAARIVDGLNGVAFETREDIGADRFGPARSSDYQLDMPVGDLPAGPYLLTIEARAGKTTVRRDVPFRMR